jgi:hypothetical protein
MTSTYASVDELLATARTALERLDPREAHARVAAGGLIVDIRPAWSGNQMARFPVLS